MRGVSGNCGWAGVGLKELYSFSGAFCVVLLPGVGVPGSGWVTSQRGPRLLLGWWAVILKGLTLILGWLPLDEVEPGLRVLL